MQFFYYTGGNSYPGSLAQFQKRVVWAGDLNRKDASIEVAQMQFSDNGTYQCDVKNPPDITGSASQIKVRVVMKGESNIIIVLFMFTEYWEYLSKACINPGNCDACINVENK